MNKTMIEKENKYGDLSWIKMGLEWALIMFIFMTLIFPIADSEAITWKSVLIGIPVWAIAGLGYGYTMKLYLQRQERKRNG